MFYVMSAHAFKCVSVLYFFQTSLYKLAQLFSQCYWNECFYNNNILSPLSSPAIRTLLSLSFSDTFRQSKTQAWHKMKEVFKFSFNLSSDDEENSEPEEYASHLQKKLHIFCRWATHLHKLQMHMISIICIHNYADQYHTCLLNTSLISYDSMWRICPYLKTIINLHFTSYIFDVVYKIHWGEHR